MSTLKELHDNMSQLITAMEQYLNQYRPTYKLNTLSPKMFMALKKNECRQLEKLCPPPSSSRSTSLLNKSLALKAAAKENVHLRFIKHFKIKLHKIEEQTRKVNRHNTQGLPKRKLISRGKPIDQWASHCRFLNKEMKKIQLLVIEIQTIDSETAAKYNDDDNNCRYTPPDQNGDWVKKSAQSLLNDSGLIKQPSALLDSKPTQNTHTPSTPLIGKRSQTNAEPNCFKTCFPCFFSQTRTITELNNPVTEYAPPYKFTFNSLT